MLKSQQLSWGQRLAIVALLSSVLIGPCLAAKTGGGPNGGRIKCWHNKDGVRECGNVVPAEYAQQGTETKDKFGVTVAATERAKTMEELEAERAVTKQKEAALEDGKKRDAQDRVLLDTFTSEDDMVLTRDGQIAHLESQIHLVDSHIEKLQKNLDQMIERAAEFERRGEKPPVDVVKNVDNVRGQLSDNHKFIATKRREQDAIRVRFEKDIARFRELKGIPAPTAKTAAAAPTAATAVAPAPSTPPGGAPAATPAAP
jgi:hypothetical protein